MIKRTVSLILAVMMLACLLCACGDKTAETKNVPAADIAAAITEATGKTDALSYVPDSWLKGWMKSEASDFGDYAVCINSIGANVDEFGIFKAGEGKSVSEIEEMVKSYLELRLLSWMDEYMPEEKYKVEDAEYKIVGNYVMYTILSAEDAQAAYSVFNEMLG